MKPGGRSWQVAVVLVGLALAGIAGILASPHIGSASGTIWSLWLIYVFALGYGANRLQLWLARPPVAPWKGAFVGVTAFIPMFLGWFPASNWTMGVGETTRYEYVPSPVWILALMFWGLLAPGGVLFDVIGRAFRKPSQPLP